MAVIMVKIHDNNRNVHGMPQSIETHPYPVISHNTACEIRGAELIGRWVDVIKETAATRTATVRTAAKRR